MHRRLWLSVAMLAVGASLLVAASFAGSASSSPSVKGSQVAKKGGTLRVDLTEDIDDVDPSISYGATDWQIWYATSLRLLNYPDARPPRGSRLTPEAAVAFPKVSNGGKTYTFTIRKGLKFSNGKPVTAKNFAFAIERALSKPLNSPAGQFVADPAGTNIVGAVAAAASATPRMPSGVKASGNKLTIKLVKQDATFLAKITMPFFQALPTSLSLTSPIVNVSGSQGLPSAGPYYVSSRTPDRSLFLKRNTHYKGPRPHNLTAIQFKIGIAIEAGFREVESGAADYGPIPPTEHARLGQTYGVNRGQYRVNPSTCNSFLALNNANDLFRGNVKLRQAVNFAISRGAMVAQYGAFAGQPNDQFLPPGFPGFRNANIYPLQRPNLTKAQSLAKGNTRSGKASYFYTRRAPSPNVMEINRADLNRIGIDLQPKSFAGFDIYDAMGKRGSEHDLGIGGWCQDYPDPYDYINVLEYGGSIQPEHNNNYAYFNNPTYNKKIERAAKLIGAARLKAYGDLDIDITKNQAPYAAWRTSNTREFFSKRVDPKSIIYTPIYEATDYAALALK
jgi:peptide/nickel transport system substrate-binding protein